MSHLPTPDFRTVGFKTPAIGLANAWLLCAVISMLVFTSLSAIDVRFSRIFFDGFKFPAANVQIYQSIRHFTWNLGLLLALLCAIGSVFGFFRRPFLWVEPRKWYFSTLLIVTGPGLVVNEGLKKFWGRARPAEILEFGGTQDFTPALIPADQCARNCSFVSGEASSAVALAVIVWVLTAHVKGQLFRRALRFAAILLAITASFLRIYTGRHFLSDVIFAALIVTGLALLLRPVLPKPVLEESK